MDSFKSHRRRQPWALRRSSSEDNQKPEFQRSRRQQCHAHKVQATNERLHAVCQEI